MLGASAWVLRLVYPRVQTEHPVRDETCLTSAPRDHRLLLSCSAFRASALVLLSSILCLEEVRAGLRSAFPLFTSVSALWYKELAGDIHTPPIAAALSDDFVLITPASYYQLYSTHTLPNLTFTLYPTPTCDIVFAPPLSPTI